MWYHVIFSAMVEFIFSFDLSLFTYNHFFFLLQWIIFVSGHMRTNVELKENFIFSFTHSHHLVVKKSPIVFISIHVLYCLLKENRRSVSLVVVQEQMVCNFMDIICGILIYAV